MKNFLRGLAAGIAIGYLTAPRSGKETREQLSDTLNGMKENWDEAKTQITELIEDVKAQVGISSTDDPATKPHNKSFAELEYEAKYAKERPFSQYNDSPDDRDEATKAGLTTTEGNLPPKII